MSFGLIEGMMNRPEPRKYFQDWEPDEQAQKMLRVVGIVWGNLISGGLILAVAPFSPILAANSALAYLVLKEVVKRIILGDEDPMSPLLEKGVDKGTAETIVRLLEKLIDKMT